MIFYITFWLLSIISAILVYILGNLYANWYLFFVPIILIFVFFVLYFLLYIIILYIWSLCLSIKKEKRKPNLFYYFIVKQTIYLIVKFSKVKVQISGLDKLPKNQKFLFISNHLSNYDPLLFINCFRNQPMICITKKENETVPIVGKFIHNAGFIALDRQDAHQAIKAIKKASEFIANNDSYIHVCPEGTRSKTGQLLNFHPGTFKIAMKVKSPIAICAINNTNFIHKNAPWKKTIVHIDILKTLYYTDYENLNSTELSLLARDLIDTYQKEKNTLKK